MLSAPDEHAVTTPGDESAELARLEGVIEAGCRFFVEVGEAFFSIRDRKLFRSEWRTFDDYCRDRWKQSRQRIDQLIAGAITYRNLELSCRSMTTDVVILPRGEYQIRHLIKLEPDDQIAAWKDALTAAGGCPTEKVVKEVVAGYLGPPPDRPFYLPGEAEAIESWLERRRESWPAGMRPQFVALARSVLDRMEAADDVPRGDREGAA